MRVEENSVFIDSNATAALGVHVWKMKGKTKIYFSFTDEFYAWL